ncbi:N-6 DNA methylase [Streptomyces thinghirensis]|uniref:N-6 DNA methylase n=1 Tax=Streptomyces thinghirensis TaxID=551547 RepID=UPI0031E86336
MECVVALPDRLFSGTSVPVCAWLLRHPADAGDHVLGADLLGPRPPLADGFQPSAPVGSRCVRRPCGHQIQESREGSLRPIRGGALCS